MELIYQTQYFIVYETYYPKRKTPILNIVSKDGSELGEIKWFGRWRKFCYYPYSNTVWDNKCLTNLVTFLNEYNSKWRSIK